MLLHIEFLHADNQPIIRGIIDIPDMSEEHDDEIKKLIYMKQDLVLSCAHRFKMNVKHHKWSKTYYPIHGKDTKTVTFL